MASGQATAHQSGKPIRKSAVTSSFIFKYNEQKKNFEVALFRRSGKVNTYQHKLAPVSGSVEKEDAGPLATALREINEETTLDVSSIELLRKGKPYTFSDQSVGREWTINPFGWRLKTTGEGGRGEEDIRIDWEHEGWEWYDPLKVEDSDEFGGVPHLADSLRRVWPEYDLGHEAGQVLTEGLLDLRKDHESGARQLAGKAVLILRDVITKTGSVAAEGFWANLRMTVWHLWKNGRESMGAAIISALIAVLSKIEPILDQNLPEDEERGKILAALDEYVAHRKSAAERLSDNFIGHVGGMDLSSSVPPKTLKVLTLSFSSTIASCLSEVAAALDITLDLRILESRPLCEGVSLATKLLAESEKKKLNVTLYSDASAALAAKDVDILLLGADRISSEGDVSNKTGSLPVVLSARHVSPSVRILVLGEVEKIAGPGMPGEHVTEDNDPTELTRAWEHNVNAQVLQKFMAQDGSRMTPGLKVKNVYFEWVPANLIDVYITDEGEWKQAEIKKSSDWIGKETDRYFDGL